MEIVLKYTMENSSQNKLVYEEDVEEIIIKHNHKIQSIDLSPLSSCDKLRVLDLRSNPLQSINLSSLSTCINLEKLLLWSTNLKNIDLSPLSSCTKIRELWFVNNKLQAIDLSPLNSCSNLHTLILSSNKLRHIDLKPLSSCTKLYRFGIELNRIKRIDLGPLTSCLDLFYLHMSSNQIRICYPWRIDPRRIDLNPISKCTELGYFRIAANLLKNIDLAPLGFCTNLQDISINNNQLQSVDLTPLGSCKNLNSLRLSGNPLSHIDLTPLSTCTELNYLPIEGVHFKSIDLTPLGFTRMSHMFGNPDIRQESILSETSFKNTRLRKRIVFEAPVHFHSLAAIAFTLPLVIMEPEQKVWKKVHLLHAAQTVMEMNWMGLIDTDDYEVLKTILTAKSDKSRKRELENLKTIVLHQIDKGGTTIGLNIERMALESGEFARRVPQVTELRTKELERVKFLKLANQIDLKPLWLTEYGHQILTTLGYGTTCSKYKFGEVRKAFGVIGHKFRTTKKRDIKFPTEMSDGLREYIWHVADYNAEKGPTG